MRRGIGRDDGFQAQDFAGLGFDLGRVNEAVAAAPRFHSYPWARIGNDVAALVVGGDDAAELGGQIEGFGDHPNACPGPLPEPVTTPPISSASI